MMDYKRKRLDIFFEQHIGVGVRWATGWGYQLVISIALPFVTFAIGLGREAD